MKRREFFGIAAALPTVAMADLSGVEYARFPSGRSFTRARTPSPMT